MLFYAYSSEIATLSACFALSPAPQTALAQVMLLGEAQQYVQQAEVPEELVALEEVSKGAFCSWCSRQTCSFQLALQYMS